MGNPLRGWSGSVVLCVAGAGALLGCRGQTACDPPSAGLGQIIGWRKSEAYQAQIDKNRADVPHLACRAETVIRTFKAYIRESEDANCSSSGKTCIETGTMDPRLVPGGMNVHSTQGEFRVLGLGQGVEEEDCGQAAMAACEQGVDGYFTRSRAVRPPMIQCRLAGDHDRCAAGVAKPRALEATAPADPTAPPAPRDPSVWIPRLADVQRRPAAVRALAHFFSDAMAKSNQNLGDPAVRALLDLMVEPFARVYVEGNLERTTRLTVIKFLADARDARGGPAFIHAARGFAKGAGADEDDLGLAARGIEATKFEEGAPALGDAFAKLEAGSSQGGAAAKNVADAMMRLKSPAWKGMLLEKIARPIERPLRSAEPQKVAAYQTELYWQQTAADLLGTYGDGSAAKPLLKVIMDKEKVEVAAVALRSITRLGAVAVSPLVEIVSGRDAEMVEIAKTQAPTGGDGKAYVRAAAVGLGAIGRADGRPALIQALKAADNDLNRAVVARELTALPPTAEAEKAFQSAYDKVPATASIWPSMFAARPALLTAASRWYDPELVPWLLNQAQSAKGNEEIHNAGLVSAVRLMKSVQVAKVKPVVEKLGDASTKVAFQAATQVLSACSEDADCYLAKLKTASKDDSAEAMVGLKAAHMVGVLGDTRAGMEIVRQLPQIQHAEVRAAAVNALDHAVQIDANAVADALQKLLDTENKEAPGPLASTAAEQVAFRLRSR